MTYALIIVSTILIASIGVNVFLYRLCKYQYELRNKLQREISNKVQNEELKRIAKGMNIRKN